MSRLLLVVVLPLAALGLAGCGGGSEDADAVPPDLVGTYTTTLADGDVPPNAAPELTPGQWKLVIATTGGVDGGPVLAIEHPVEGNLEGPGLRVDGDRFLLEDEECAAGPNGSYAFYDNEYSYTLDGSTLTLATVRNDCPDRVAETILTSGSWTKVP